MKEKLIKYLDKAFITLMVINLVLIVLGSVFILSDKAFVKNAERTKGYISHIEKQDDGKEKYIFTYFLNGETYETEYKFVDKDTYIGDEMYFYYNPENAEDIYIKTKPVWYVLVYLGLGLAAAEIIAYLPLICRCQREEARYFLPSSRLRLAKPCIGPYPLPKLFFL